MSETIATILVTPTMTSFSYLYDRRPVMQAAMGFDPTGSLEAL